MNTNMNRRRFSAGLFSAGAAARARRRSAGLRTGRAGRSKARTSPASRRPSRRACPPGKVEVLEFFSYACPHCSAFEPTLEAWEKQLPADVVLRRVPVPFLMNADNFMHTYYALETIGAVQAMQLKIFRAIHIERKRLETGENIAAFVGKNGGRRGQVPGGVQVVLGRDLGRPRQEDDGRLQGRQRADLIVQGRWMTSLEPGGLARASARGRRSAGAAPAQGLISAASAGPPALATMARCSNRCPPLSRPSSCSPRRTSS